MDPMDASEVARPTADRSLPQPPVGATATRSATDARREATSTLGTDVPPEAVARALVLTARALFAYGVATLVLAALALVGTAIAAIRVDASAERLSDRITRVATALDSSATALDEAASGGTRFSTTLGDLQPTLERTTTSLRSGSRTLTEMASTANNVDVLGSRPFGNLSTSLTDTASQLDQLATSLEGDASKLGDSRAELQRMADVLPPVSRDLRRLRDGLEPDIDALVGLTRRSIPLLGAAVALWLAIPGLGAVLLGRELSRTLGVPMPRPFDRLNRGVRA